MTSVRKNNPLPNENPPSGGETAPSATAPAGRRSATASDKASNVVAFRKPGDGDPAPSDLDNRTFLRTLFPQAAKNAWVTAFADDPDVTRDQREQGRLWGGAIATSKRGNKYWQAVDQNTFYVISTFREDAEGVIRRRKALFRDCRAIMIDDVGKKGTRGVKVDGDHLELITGLEPSYIIETSPGNCQWGIILREPETRQWAVEQLQDGMIAKGLTADQKDPGMANVTRYCRLPEGVNTKAKHVKANGGEPWRHVVHRWEPTRRYTVEELADLFDIKLVEPEALARRGASPDEYEDDPVLLALDEAGLLQGPLDDKGRGYHVTCINQESHTGGRDDGAAYFRRGSVDEQGKHYPIGGFNCFHGGCAHLNAGHLIRWLEKEGYLESEMRSADEVFAGLGEPNKDYDEVEEDLYKWPSGHPRDQAKMYLAARCHRDGVLALRHHQGVFYRHDGVCYRAQETAALRNHIGDWAERFYVFPKAKKDEKPVPERLTVGSRTISEILDPLSGITLVPELTSQPSWIDARSDDPPAIECIPCLNGVLHAPTRKLLPPTARLWSVNAVDYNFEPNANCPEFERFVGDVFAHDESAVHALQEMFGYLVTQDTSQQKLFFVIGPTRSGKGTLARLLMDLVGMHNGIAPSLDDIPTRFGKAPLIGKQLAIVSDAQFGAGKDQVKITEALKTISGADPISTDRKNISTWTGRLNTRFVIMSNSLPMLNDPSGALAGRAIIFKMIKSYYGKEDLGLYNRLSSELPGILNWSLAGLDRLRERGHFEPPKSSEESLARLQDIVSPVKAFAREYLEFGEGFEEKVADVYAAWRGFCDRAGRRSVSTSNHFSADLTSAFPEVESSRLRREGERNYYFTGVRLTEAYRPASAFADLALGDERFAR